MRREAIAALAVGAIMGILLVYLASPPAPQVEKPPVVTPKPPEEKPKPTFKEVVNSITSEELKKDLYFLASDKLEGRMSGKKGNVVAAEFIKKKFESFGLPTMYHKFDIRRVNASNERGDDFTQNIYAWIEGNDPEVKDEIVVIGAHMDHIGYGPSYSHSRSRWLEIHPGADDNASGTVALLQIAEAFSALKDKVRRTIVFQAYSGEEMGLIGSRYYCNNPTFPRDNPSIKRHVFHLNMDMIGYLGQGTFHATWNSRGSSVDVQKHINDLDKKYSFAKNITSRSSGGSDHASFYNKRIPVAFLHTGSHSNYHRPSDTADKIDYKGLEQVARYGFELVWQICQEDSKPRFNHTNFQVMKYIHDHGHKDGTRFQIYEPEAVEK